MKEESPFSVGSSLVDVDADAVDAVLGSGTAAAHLTTKRRHHASGASAIAAPVLSASNNAGKIELLDNFLFQSGKASSSSAADVVEVEAPKGNPSSSSGNSILSFMDRLKPTSAAPMPSSFGHESNLVASSSNLDKDSVPYGKPKQNSSLSSAPIVIDEIKAKMSIFGSSTLATLRRAVNTNATGVNTVQPAPDTTRIHDVNSPSKHDVFSAGIKDTPKGAFVIDDDDEGASGSVEQQDSSMPGNGGPSDVTEQDVATTKSAHPRIGGAKRMQSNSNLHDGQQTLARLQGIGLVDVDDTKIGVTRTEAEKAQALAMHKLAGLRKGDKILISRESLPGAVLFPCRKLKSITRSTESGHNPEFEALENSTLFPVGGISDDKG